MRRSFGKIFSPLLNLSGNKKMAIPVIFIVCAVFFFISSFWIPIVEFEASQVGPRFFPRMLLCFIIFLNILLIFKSKKENQSHLSAEEPSSSHKKRFVGTVISAIVFVILFSWLGAYVAMFFFVLGFLIVWGIRTPLTLILTPSLTSIGVYLVFHKLLEVRLPKGIFGSFL